jgi:phospholipid/cholesterol/gamma-HCH transport system permease protein
MSGDLLLLAAGGAWTAVHVHKLEPVVESIEREAAGIPAVALDLQGVVALDTFGAWLIERLIRAWRSVGGEARLLGVPEHCRELLEEVQGVNRTSARVPAREIGLMSALERIGRSVVALGRSSRLPWPCWAHSLRRSAARWCARRRFG